MSDIFKGTKWGKASEQVSVAMPTTWDHGATGPANRVGLVTEPAVDADPVTGKIVTIYTREQFSLTRKLHKARARAHRGKDRS